MLGKVDCANVNSALRKKCFLTRKLNWPKSNVSLLWHWNKSLKVFFLLFFFKGKVLNSESNQVLRIAMSRMALCFAAVKVKANGRDELS